jgi:hypothetical protein
MTIQEWDKRLAINIKLLKVGSIVKLDYVGKNPLTSYGLNTEYLNKRCKILSFCSYSPELVNLKIELDGKTKTLHDINIARLKNGYSNYPKSSVLEIE